MPINFLVLGGGGVWSRGGGVPILFLWAWGHFSWWEFRRPKKMPPPPQKKSRRHPPDPSVPSPPIFKKKTEPPPLPCASDSPTPKIADPRKERKQGNPQNKEQGSTKF